MNDGYMDAAAVPVPDQMADALQSALPLATFLAPNKLPLDARDVAQMQAHRLRGQGYRLVPVPDAGDDTLRDEMARTITSSLHGGRWIDMTPRKIADALLPQIRAHVAARPPTQWAYDQACEALHKHRERAERAERERDENLQNVRKIDDLRMAEIKQLNAAIERVRALADISDWHVYESRDTGDVYPAALVQDLVADIRAALDGAEATP